MGSPLLGLVRLVAYLAWTAILMPVQALAVRFGWRLRQRLPRFYHARCVRLLGLDLDERGTRSHARPTLFVSNHCSYLDIAVLGALIEGSFVAKTEVARWPFFGLLAKLQETVFIARAVRQDAARQRDDMQGRLEKGDNLILFPEGTSSDGNRTLPFKTALFSVAGMEVDGRPLVVQPVSLTPTALDGIPLGRELRPLYAWYGDMALAPHMWRFLRLGRMRVTVEFHPPVTVRDVASRKALADHCARVVAAGMARAIAGSAGATPAEAAGAGPSAVDSAPRRDASVAS